MDRVPGVADAAGHLRLGAVILAAGAGSRFGGRKMGAELGGRPLLQHVLDVVADVPLVRVVVVLAPDSAGLERIVWRDAMRIVNPDPALGLSNSLRLGLDSCAAGDDLDGLYILLGDQPLTAVSTLLALSDAASEALVAGARAVVPDYADGGGANPVLLLRAGFPLASRLIGDRGLGSVLAERPDLLQRVRISGSNPDVDTVADLRALELGP